MWYQTSSYSSIFGPFLCLVQIKAIFTAALPISCSCCLEIRSPNLVLSFLSVSHPGLIPPALLRPWNASSLRMPSGMGALGLAWPWELCLHPLHKSLETCSQMRIFIFHSPLEEQSKCFCQVSWARRENLEGADGGGILWVSPESLTPARIAAQELEWQSLISTKWGLVESLSDISGPGWGV